MFGRQQRSSGFAVAYGVPNAPHLFTTHDIDTNMADAINNMAFVQGSFVDAPASPSSNLERGTAYVHYWR